MHVALYCSAFWVYSIASSSGSHSIFFLQLQLLTSAFLGFQVSRKQNACEESTRIIVTQKSSHTLAVTTTPGSGTAPCSSCLLTSTVGLYEPHKTEEQANNQTNKKAMSKPSTHTRVCVCVKKQTLHRYNTNSPERKRCVWRNKLYTHRDVLGETNYAEVPKNSLQKDICVKNSLLTGTNSFSPEIWFCGEFLCLLRSGGEEVPTYLICSIWRWW
jgi:hypothetical protein